MRHTPARKSSAQKPGPPGPLPPTAMRGLQAANVQVLQATTVLDAAMVQATETTKALEELLARFDDQVAGGPMYRLASIGADLHAAVKMRARAEGRTVPQVVSQALHAYLQGSAADEGGGRQARAGEGAMSGDPVTIEMDERWHQFLALAMFKLGVTDVTVFTEDITNFAVTYGPGATVIADSAGDHVTLRLVDETQAGQLARKTASRSG